MDVSRSAYYDWKTQPVSKRESHDMILVSKIREVHAISRGTYGSPRVHEELKAQGVAAGRHRVAKLMRLDGLRGKQRKRFTKTTDSAHTFPVAPNLLNQNFDVKSLDTVWASDITFIPTGEGWLYLATTLDLCSRKIVGWSMSATIDRHLVMAALRMAIGRRHPPRGLLHHSDRGSQYASYDFQNLLKAHGMVCSMSGRGNCYDNAVQESFYHTLKVELVHERSYRSRAEARTDIVDYIERFYNRVRRHSSLGYQSPTSYETLITARMSAS